MQDSMCQSCDKGKYKADPGNAQNLCVSCTEGTYSDAVNSIECLPCTPNSQSGASSTSASDCSCNAGFHHGSDNTCVPAAKLECWWQSPHALLPSMFHARVVRLAAHHKLLANACLASNKKAMSVWNALQKRLKILPARTRVNRVL